MILKQLHLFWALILQADSTAMIPPYLTLNRHSRGFKDISATFSITAIKGMATIKRFFHRFFPRVEGGHFYCNVILATTCSPESLKEAVSLKLRDNRLAEVNQRRISDGAGLVIIFFSSTGRKTTFPNLIKIKGGGGNRSKVAINQDEHKCKKSYRTGRKLKKARSQGRPPGMRYTGSSICET